MRVTAILNANGGTIRTAGAEATRKRLAEAFAKRDVEAEIVLARGAEIGAQAKHALERAKRGEIDAVVIGGGDGTIGSVAGIVAGSGVPLGVLPLGTRNHFAKALGLPFGLEEAAAAIAAGATREIDVGEVNGRVFINNSSVGVYPYMVAERDRRMEAEGRRKWTAMGLAFVRMVRRFPRRRLSIEAEGWTAPCKSPLVFVGNNEYGFGLLDLGKRVRLDGGELSLYVAKQRRPLGLFKLVVEATFGRLDDAEDFDIRHVRQAEIRTRASRLPVAVDGEVVVLTPPLRYRIRPRTLRVFAPPAEAA
jgi:diacylglycerol kinase family enzyme